MKEMMKERLNQNSLEINRSQFLFNFFVQQFVQQFSVLISSRDRSSSFNCLDQIFH